MSADHQIVTLMVRKKYLGAPVLYWEFFRSRFLLPTPEENKNTQELIKHMSKRGHGGKHRLPDAEAKATFLEWVHSKWRPKVDYPKPFRAKANHYAGSGIQLAAFNFEAKLFNYYDSLLGPDRVVRAGKSTLPGLEEQLGLFCVRDMKLYSRSKDIKYLWGDAHQFNGTDDEWNKYSRTHSSCFDLKNENGVGKNYVLSGPLSLCNHNCKTAFLTIVSGGFANASGSNNYKKGDEIFVNYGDDYFNDRKCVCCK